MDFAASNLSRTIDGRTLYTGVSFSLAPGERLIVQGASGAGKSTLLRALAWLDPVDAGTVRLGGHTPADWGVPRWRARVAYVAQRPPAHPGTPAETWVAAQRYRAHPDDVGEPRQWLEDWGVRAGAWVAPWSRLSGGEGQRVSLALALALRPAVLLLDEPTSALDPDAAARVEQSLAVERAVVVTHDTAQAARLGGRVLWLGAA